MTPLQPGTAAPPIPGVALDGPSALLFYKVTCPTCQMAAPAAEALARRFPARFASVVQDPPERAQGFAGEYGAFPAVSDDPPYDLSNAYGIRVVPTLFTIEGGTVTGVVESWNRDAWNEVAARLAEAEGVAPELLSSPDDGLPPFRPG